MPKEAKQIGDEKTVFSGQIIEVIQRKMQSGDTTKTFERARRSPGTRLIIINPETEQILLTREYRYEIEAFDYRLPGGKVCNTLEQYLQILDNGNIDDSAKNAAILEANQEAGINPKDIDLFQISKSGGPTIEWDLYYYVIKNFDTQKQDLEFGENISIEWLPYQKAINLILSGLMKEDRSVGVLMKYFRSIGKI